MPSAHTLYISYFGLREPLVQTQVLPYLRELTQAGIRVSLLTFEPQNQRWTKDQIESSRAELERENISWHQRTYHKRPSLPATLYDVAAGVRLARKLVRNEGVNVLHARGHVAALMASLVKRTEKSVRIVFDIRGFMPEEYTDAGVWPANGYLYRGVKKVERFLFSSADAFVVLTAKARQILFGDSSDEDQRGRPIELIPCCVDFKRFDAADGSRTEMRRQLNLDDRQVIVYVGSFGGWYMTDEMTTFLAQAHQQNPATFSMILTQSAPETVIDRMTAHGIAERDFSVAKVAPSEIPRYLNAADLAISFIKPCFSKLSSSPTKIAEYLASGLPIVCNSGVGDLDELIEQNRAGALLHDFTSEAYSKALQQIDALRAEKDLGERLRAVARREFDLVSIGGTRYRRLYQRLLQTKPAAEK